LSCILETPLKKCPRKNYPISPHLPPSIELLEAKLYDPPSPFAGMAGHSSKDPVKVKYLKLSTPEIILGIRSMWRLNGEMKSAGSVANSGPSDRSQDNEPPKMRKEKDWCKRDYGPDQGKKKLPLIFEQMNETKRNEAGQASEQRPQRASSSPTPRTRWFHAPRRSLKLGLDS
jgi:hypothetical protein